MNIRHIIAAAALVMAGTSANAIINQPVPTNLIVQFDGMEWAWASPCPPGAQGNSCSSIDLSYQSQFGWRLPNASILPGKPNG